MRQCHISQDSLKGDKPAVERLSTAPKPGTVLLSCLASGLSLVRLWASHKIYRNLLLARCMEGLGMVLEAISPHLRAHSFGGASRTEGELSQHTNLI